MFNCPDVYKIEETVVPRIGSEETTYPVQTGIVRDLRLPRIWPQSSNRTTMEQDEAELRQETTHEEDGGTDDDLQQSIMSRAQAVVKCQTRQSAHEQCGRVDQVRDIIVDFSLVDFLAGEDVLDVFEMAAASLTDEYYSDGGEDDEENIAEQGEVIV